jgi:hypothetical protein
MVISYLKGGLGNYLFQIAHGYSLSLDNNDNFGIDLNKIWVVHSHWSEYIGNIFRNVSTVSTPSQTYNYTYESLTYKSTPYKENIFLDGYFQSEKYFIHNKQKILDFFKIDKITLDYLKDKYSTIVDGNDTCSIHVRRGDFLGIDFYNKLNMDYYNKAINLVGKDKHFVIFSNDIPWCKENFIGINATFIENEKDYVDMYLMSLCKDNITSNSTFSWWGSYLNPNINEKIYTPIVWFIHSHSNEDIIPSEWIKIN